MATASSSSLQYSTSVGNSGVGSDVFSFRPTPTLLTLYAFFAPLGNLARFGTEEGGYGLTTVILIVVVAINLPAIGMVMKRNRVLFFLALLVSWMAFASIFSNDLLAALAALAQFALYVLFAAAAYRVKWTSETIRKVLLFLMLGALLSSFLTIVDFFGIIDVPRVNEGSGLYTATDFGAVLQASGPFVRRSAMAAYFAIVIPVGVQGFLRAKDMTRLLRWVFLFSAVAAAISLLLTHNRAGILGALLSILAINVYLARSPAKVVRLLVLTGMVFGSIAWVLKTYFSAQLFVYEALLHLSDNTAAGSYVEADGDAIRYILFKYSLTSIGSNPVGHGFTLVTGVPRHPDADPHNILTQIIWGAGVFGIGWIFYFSGMILSRVRPRFGRAAVTDPFSRYMLIIGSGLLGWFFCGMMHQILGNGLAWLFLGMVLKMATAEIPSSLPPRVAA